MKNDIKDTIKIIHEDAYVIAIDKPNGVVVNRSNTSKDSTIQDFIDSYCPIKNIDTISTLEKDMDYDLELEEYTSRSGILHRLDKDTSGILLVAKTFESFRKFKSLFKEREIQKEYIAIVMGEVKDLKIEINAPLKRNPKNPMKFAVVSEGKPAMTLIERIKVFKRGDGKFTLLRVFPKTGRTHQIRVHLCAINHPIVGDPVYLTKHTFDVCSEYFPRLMLHAKSLKFNHPFSNDLVSYSSDVPEIFEI